MQNRENSDKILKIFSRVHCFNKDQLPRYVDGRLTHIEKHLIEQHLVNCELCSSAVDILQKEKHKAEYPAMSSKVQQYIRDNTQLSQAHEGERYQKKVEVGEKFLVYFWGAVAAALVIGGIHMIKQQSAKDDMQQPMARVEKGISISSNEPVAQQTVVDGPVAVSKPAAVSGSATASEPASLFTPAVSRTEAPSPKGQMVQSAAVLTAVQPSVSTTQPVAVTKDESLNTDESLYRSAMSFYKQGNLDEAMPRLTQLTTDTTSHYKELARFQLAMCYKFKHQKAHARAMFKELIGMNGKMKRRAQLALNKL
jgi:TolA-binding protein